MGEREHERTDVQCHSFRLRKFPHADFLKDAKFQELTWSQNELAHKYTDIQFEPAECEECKWNVEHSELYLNAFTHEPTEFNLIGSVEHRGKKCGVAIDVLVEDFEFDIDQEKEVLAMPETVKTVCQQGKGGDLSEQHRMILMAAGIDVDA